MVDQLECVEQSGNTHLDLCQVLSGRSMTAKLDWRVLNSCFPQLVSQLCESCFVSALRFGGCRDQMVSDSLTEI